MRRKKRLREAPIDYEGPERMSPDIERKLSTGEHPLGKHQAFPEVGGDDSFEEVIASKRFKDVIDRVKRATGLETVDPASTMSIQPMMQELQMISDKISAPILAQLTQDLLLSIGQGTDEDPLVKIRQQELELRRAELDEDNRQFDERENTRREGQLLENEIAKQRIATTKQVADDKLDLAIARLQQQADIKLSEMQAKFGGQR